jgi:ABC-type lipoprotein export system ATPase subunit
VAPGTELTFDRRGVILLGKNGTGKTTLLELLASICKCDFGSVAHDDYDLEFSMSCAGNVELSVAARRDKPHPNPFPDLISKEFPKAALSFQQSRRRQTLRIEAQALSSGERTIIESSDSDTKCTFPNGDLATYPLAPDEGWRLLGLGAYKAVSIPPLWEAFTESVQQATNLRRFDEGLDYFRDLTGVSPTSARIKAIVQDGVYGLDVDSTALISPNCAGLLLKDFRKNKERSTAGFIDSSEIPYLELFCRLAGFQRAQLGADLDEKQRTENLEFIRLSPLRFSLERNGSVLHHHHLSFGQRRLLAFLHYHDSTPSLIIADELVNGMHHEWIVECLKLMRDSQAFLSSQNPLLFDFMTFESAEEVANRFIICELDEQHRFVWRNMSEPDAIEFYETYKAGLQHVSEILRTRGYW